MKVSIVIPWYNTEWLADKNLPTLLLALRNPNNHISEIIIVDDVSTDRSVEIIKKKYPEIKLIRHKINRGYSATANTGVRSAKSELICLLDSDVLVTTNFLDGVIKDFEDKKVFAVGLNETNQSGWKTATMDDGFLKVEVRKGEGNTHNTFFVICGTGVFRRTMWISLGGADEKLFSPFTWEDVDLSYRALKRGYILKWEPKGKVLHKHGETTFQFSKKFVENTIKRNELLFMWKNLTSLRLMRKHIVGVIKRVVRHPGYLRVVILALLKIGPLIKARSKERRESKVSDEVIFSRFF